MSNHNLKSNPEYFKASWAGVKPFEIRRNDRNFQLNDEVVLLEWDPFGKDHPSIKGLGAFTGREICGFIDYITDFEQKPGYVVFAIRETRRSE